MRLWKFIKDEANYIVEVDPACRSIFEALMYPSLRAVVHHKLANYLYRKNKIWLARYVSQRSRHKTGIEIHPGATLGRHVFIDHGTGVVIGETAIVGDNVTIYHGVTLGGTGKEKGKKRHPTVGNNVLIGSHATILGDITIGDNAKVGAMALVNKDVPPNTTAVGIPFRIIPHDEKYDRKHRYWKKEKE